MEIWIFDQMNAALRLTSYETFHTCYCQFHRIFKKFKEKNYYDTQNNS